MDKEGTCLECGVKIGLADDTVQGEMLQCPDCGVDLEVTSLEPLTLDVAPQEEEDWGE